MGNKGDRALPEFKPYSEFAHAHRKKRKTDDMTAQQLIDHLCAHL